MTFDLHNPETHNIKNLSAALQAKTISSVELTQNYLERAKSSNEILNSFISFTEEAALHQAKIADAKIAAGSATTLTGIPVAHKDVFCTLEGTTTCASHFLEHYHSPIEATAVERLKSAGMPMLGKLNMDEFAMGSSNENSFFGTVKNPWNLERVPGGSSGGSAAAVAASLTPIATGTDTGGSIRQPAAFCGISGIKPTNGRISRWGMIAYASSFDQAGPMAKSVEDLAYSLEVMAGFDPKDSTVSNQTVDPYVASLDTPLAGKKIGLPKEYFTDKLDSTIGAAIDRAVKDMTSAGAEFTEVSLPSTDAAIAAYYVLASAEASANLQRFDGVRFGHRSDKAEDLEALYKYSRAEGFGEEVKRRILTGTFVLSAGYYDAYFRKAQRVRRLIMNEFKSVLSEVDALLMPVTPTTAFKLGATQDPVAMYMNDIYSVTANLAGMPAMAIPCGMDKGLPIGMQLLGDHFREATLLNIGHQYQQISEHHLARPTQAFA